MQWIKGNVQFNKSPILGGLWSQRVKQFGVRWRKAERGRWEAPAHRLRCTATEHWAPSPTVADDSLWQSLCWSKCFCTLPAVPAPPRGPHLCSLGKPSHPAMKRRHHHSHFTGDQSETQRGSRAPSSPTQDTFSLGLLGPFLSCYFSCSCGTQLHQLGLHTAIQLDKAVSGFKALSDFRAVWHQEGPRQGPHLQGIYNPATKMTLDIDSNQIHSGMPHVLRKGKDRLLLRMDLKW